MASTETRHAAWQTERRFAVRLLPESGPPTKLADGLTEFLDAFDLAFEWLNREDPARTGSATLAIVETCDGVSEEVWTYPPLPGNGQELVTRLGFNPVSWAGVPEYSTDERKSRLRQRIGADEPREAEAPWEQIERAVEAETAPTVAPKVEPAEAPIAAPPGAPPEPEPEPKPTSDHAEPAIVHVTTRKWILTNVRVAWADRLSRCCLVLSGASLWFALGLADPKILAPLLVFVPTLWWRRRNQEVPAPESETEDWL